MFYNLKYRKCYFKKKDKLKLRMTEVLVEIGVKVDFPKLQSIEIEINELKEKQHNYIHGYEEET